MAELNEYLEKLKSFDFEKEIQKLIEKYQGQILLMVKKRLYDSGRDASGNLIRPEYAQSTIEWKKLNNQRHNFVTLRDSGDFYRGMFVKYENGNLIIDSTDWKVDELINKYGPDILGLTEDEQRRLLYVFLEPEIEKLISPPDQLRLDFPP